MEETAGNAGKICRRRLRRHTERERALGSRCVSSAGVEPAVGSGWGEGGWGGGEQSEQERRREVHVTGQRSKTRGVHHQPFISFLMHVRQQSVLSCV